MNAYFLQHPVSGLWMRHAWSENISHSTSWSEGDLAVQMLPCWAVCFVCSFVLVTNIIGSLLIILSLENRDEEICCKNSWILRTRNTSKCEEGWFLNSKSKSYRPVWDLSGVTPDVWAPSPMFRGTWTFSRSDMFVERLLNNFHIDLSHKFYNVTKPSS